MIPYVIVALLIVLSIIIAELFRRHGEAKWAKMTNDERLAALNKWRSVG